jgi:hypothetical protein
LYFNKIRSSQCKVLLETGLIPFTKSAVSSNQNSPNIFFAGGVLFDADVLLTVVLVEMGLNRFAFSRRISSGVSFLAATAPGCFAASTPLPRLLSLLAASEVQGSGSPPKIDAESLPATATAPK